MICSCIRNY